MKSKSICIAIGIFIGFLISLYFMKRLEGQQKIETKTVVKIETVTDTITETIIKEIPKTVYVEKIKTIKGETVVIHENQPSESGNIIESKQYETELKSNNATASLLITANEFYKVEGVIIYPEKETTIETIKTKNASGLFGYASLPITNLASPEVGVMLQYRNKFIVGLGAQYNNFNKNADLKVTIAVKL